MRGTLHDRWLVSFCLSRAAMYAVFMVYAACLPVLIQAWGMSAAQAGTVSGAFMLVYSVSLVVHAGLAGRFGARRVFVISTWTSAASALAFGLLARGYLSALVLYALVAAAQGGLYTPAVMLIADRYAPGVRGHAVGLLIGGTSVGYAFSLLLAAALLALGGYRLAFVVAGATPIAGAIAASLTLRRTPNAVHARGVAGAPSWRALAGDAVAVRLVVGYVGHSWELLGMWQWLPAFLAVGLTAAGGMTLDAAARGAGLAGAMHVLGSIASSTMGGLSDRLGRRRVLLGLACASTVLSFGIGWLVHAPAALLVAVALVYGFTAVGDSPVLSTALTEAVPPAHLGAALGLRSLLGFGAGTFAPVVFGATLDLAHPLGSPALAWGLAFATLGVGGAVAVACALGLGAARTAPALPRHPARPEAR